MLKLATATAAFALAAGAAFAAPQIDAPAPAFTGKASSGETVSLSQFLGKNVVLEWTNHDCPFVVKHYATGNMQETQKAAKNHGAVWVTVISSAPGTQGYVSPDKANELTTSRGAKPDYVLLDASGEIGKAYAAKTTPHMFVIDAEGRLRYDGAIDDKPSANHATVSGASNYLLAALNSVVAGEDVALAQTKPYGCSVKYAE